jgi:hypothetical protein
MLKQKSRVYQRYPGILGKEDVVAIRELVGSRRLEQQVFSMKDPISQPLLCCCIVLLGIVSLVAMVVLPILSAFLSGLPYGFTLWIPAQLMLVIWAFIIGCRLSNFLCQYIIGAVALWVFYMFGLLQIMGMIDLPWYWICVPLYSLVILVPASFCVMRQLEKCRKTNEYVLANTKNAYEEGN